MIDRPHSSNWIDLGRQRFGMLTANEFVVFASGRAFWLCRCDCGDDYLVTTSKLRAGFARSCGCARGAHISQAKYIHGSRRTSEYVIWEQMIARCHQRTSAAFKYYGGRGIGVCARWRTGSRHKHGFEFFCFDMGPRPSPGHTLDRINNRKGYSPGNCRWATAREQARNRRSTVFVTFGGARAALIDHCERLGMKYGLVLQRLRQGWKVGPALTRPSRYAQGHGDLGIPGRL